MNKRGLFGGLKWIFWIIVFLGVLFLVLGNANATDLANIEEKVDQYKNAVGDIGDKVDTLAHKDTRTDYLKQEWVKFLEKNQKINFTIYAVNYAVDKTNPVLRNVLGVNFEWKWSFFLVLILWFMVWNWFSRIIDIICLSLYESILQGTGQSKNYKYIQSIRFYKTWISLILVILVARIGLISLFANGLIYIASTSSMLFNFVIMVLLFIGLLQISKLLTIIEKKFIAAQIDVRILSIERGEIEKEKAQLKKEISSEQDGVVEKYFESQKEKIQLRKAMEEEAISAEKERIERQRAAEAGFIRNQKERIERQRAAEAGFMLAERKKNKDIQQAIGKQSEDIDEMREARVRGDAFVKGIGKGLKRKR